MPEFTEIVRSLSAEKFAEILKASSRQARETYFHRHGVKAPAGGKGFARPGAKNEARALALYDMLRERDDDEMVEELLRAWLLVQRPMLVAALDHLKIPHNNGLTDGDLSKFEKLSGGDAKALVKVLRAVTDDDDAIRIYLTFVGVKDVARAMA